MHLPFYQLHCHNLHAHYLDYTGLVRQFKNDSESGLPTPVAVDSTVPGEYNNPRGKNCNTMPHNVGSAVRNVPSFVRCND